MNTIAQFTKNWAGAGAEEPPANLLNFGAVPGLVDGDIGPLSLQCVSGPGTAIVRVYQYIQSSIASPSWVAVGDPLPFAPGGTPLRVAINGAGPIYPAGSLRYAQTGPSYVDGGIMGGCSIAVKKYPPPLPTPIGSAGSSAVFIAMISGASGSYTFQVLQ